MSPALSMNETSPAMSDQVRTRLLLLSDTHARAPNSRESRGYPCRWPLPSADVAIHTGDLTMNGKTEQHEQAIDLLKRLRADLKIVIPGNHDVTLDSSYYLESSGGHGPQPKYTEEQLRYIRDLYTSPESRSANIVYLEEGTKTFELNNGASLTIYASAYTPEFCNWAFAYPRDQDRFNPPHAADAIASYSADNSDQRANSRNVDVMLTHGPPLGILDRVPDRNPNRPDRHAGCEHLFRAVSRAKPLIHCFGHIHEGWGATRKYWPQIKDSDSTIDPKDHHPEKPTSTSVSIEVDQDKTVQEMGAYVDLTDAKRGEETLFVNASIMDVRYRPVQAPWVVDLMLPSLSAQAQAQAQAGE